MTITSIKQKTQHIRELAEIDEVSAHLAEDELMISFIREISRMKTLKLDLIQKAKLIADLEKADFERHYG